MRVGAQNWRFVGAFALLLLLASLAQAGTITQLNSYSCTGVTCDSVNWGGIGGEAASILQNTNVNSQLFSVGPPAAGNQLQMTFNVGGNYGAPECTFSNTPCGEIFQQETTGSGTAIWTGSFSTGELLASTDDFDSTSAIPVNDTMTLSFLTQNVSNFGVWIQDQDYSDPFTATISTTSDGGATFSATSTNGGAIFIGLSDTTQSIANITLSTTQTAAGGTPDFFAIGTAYFDDGVVQTGGGGNNNPGPTPEPASLIMIASGLAVLGWKARKFARS